MKVFKRVSIFIFIVLVFFIAFIFFKKKNNDAVLKKTKALNYSLTYKQAFPDENLRYAVLYCVSTGKCNDQNLEEKLKLDIVNSDGTEDWIIKPSKITPAMKSKENDRLSAVNLNSIKVFALKDERKDKRIKDLTGIEYFTIASMIVTDASATSSFDISTLTRLQKFNIYGEDSDSKACNIKTGNQGTNFKDLQVSVKASNREPVYKLDVSKLTSVETLKINYCNYQNINLGNMIRLKTLDLAYNKLTTLALRAINNYLKYFDISHNEVTSLPNFSNMPFLEHLDISYNRFPAYPFRANQFRRLKNIYAKDSGIAIIEVYESPNLEEVSLGGNKFTTFIFDSSVNTRVSKLSIIDSPITDSGLTNKQFGSLQNYPGNTNSLREFHFENLPNINSINFNNISSADKIVVKNMNIQEIVQLTAYTAKEIEITNTNIKDVSLNSNHVKKLNLSNNKMEKLNLNTANVEDVNISNNKLNNLDIYYKNISCEKINYSNNKLMTVNTDKACLSVPQHLEIKVKEGQEVTIPIKYGPATGSYHYGELVENNAIFEKTGFQKYRFKKVGTTTENFNVFYHNHDDDTNTLKGNGGDIVITVLEGEASHFTPIVNTLRTLEGYDPTFTEMDYKNAITNLPANIKNFEVDINQLDTSIPGIKNVKTKVTFSDDSVKEINVPVDVEELTPDKYEHPTVKHIIVNKGEIISDETYKTSIINLPNNIQRIDIVTRADTSQFGNQKAKVNVVLRNGQIKEIEIPVEVKARMADKFNPVFNTDIKYTDTDATKIYNDNIINLPAGASYEIINDSGNVMTIDELKNIIATQGLKNFKIKIRFSDFSEKVMQMPVEIYLKVSQQIFQYSFYPLLAEDYGYREQDNNKFLMKKNELPENGCNLETYVCYNYSFSNITFGFYGTSVNIDDYLNRKHTFNLDFLPAWNNDENRKEIMVIGRVGFAGGIVTKFNIYRDTDGDSIPDKDDDDDDNDGISDEQEIKDNTNPKDSTSYKTTKICYKVTG